jgi:3-deoxy-7-phosphoheptulonate synthase
MTTLFLLENTRVSGFLDIPSPKIVKSSLVPDIKSQVNIATARQTVTNILNGHDLRKLVIVGPCSIHDTHAAMEYALVLNELRKKYDNKLFIIMRVYFDKPRTQVGWKGFINDPHLDGTHHIYEGLFKARELLLRINALGLPVATEWLDTITPQYISDLVTLGMIGARTTESQVHRQLVSGMSMPVGFKNNMSGDIQVACDAMKVAAHPQSFLGTTNEGQIASINTRGNEDTFLVLRGSHQSTNYDPDSVSDALLTLRNNKVKPAIIVDCSHGNSRKDYKNQEYVWSSVASQIGDGNFGIKGVMLESNIHEGSQKLDDTPLKYGVSITDGCVNLQTTEELIQYLVDRVEL